MLSRHGQDRASNEYEHRDSTRHILGTGTSNAGRGREQPDESLVSQHAAQSYKESEAQWRWRSESGEYDKESGHNPPNGNWGYAPHERAAGHRRSRQSNYYYPDPYSATWGA